MAHGLGILTMAAPFLWLSQAHRGDSYARALLPGALLWGLGSGAAVTPLTTAVLAAVSDADLGETSAINDATSRLGAVIAIVPALIGVSGGRRLAHALAHGYQPAMTAMGGLCVTAARVTGRFVSNDCIAGPHPAPHPRAHGYALPVSNSAATS